MGIDHRHRVLAAGAWVVTGDAVYAADGSHTHELAGGVLKSVPATSSPVCAHEVAGGPIERVEPAVAADGAPLVLSKGVQIPADGSGLPTGIERDIPPRYRYWRADTPEVRRSIRDALADQRVVTKGAIKVIKNEVRLFVRGEDGMMHLPEWADEDVPLEIPEPLTLARDVLRKHIDEFSSYNADVVDTFGLEVVLEKASPRGHYLIELRRAEDAGAAAPAVWTTEWGGMFLSSVLPEGVTYAADVDDHSFRLLKAEMREVQEPVDGAAPTEMYLHECAAAVYAANNPDDIILRKAAVLRNVIDARLGDEAMASTLPALGIDPGYVATLRKAMGGLELISKDDAERVAIYLVLQPEVSDLQGDIMESERNIRDVAYEYVKRYRVIGIDHQRQAKSSEAALVMSWVEPEAREINGRPVRKGAFLIGVQYYDDALWNSVLRGERTGASIEGVGRRTPL